MSFFSGERGLTCPRLSPSPPCRAMMNGMVESILSFTRDDAKQEVRSIVDLSAPVEGICEDAVDAGEKMTSTGPRDVTISCRPTAMRLAISIRWTMPSSMAARPP